MAGKPAPGSLGRRLPSPGICPGAPPGDISLLHPPGFGAEMRPQLWGSVPAGEAQTTEGAVISHGAALSSVTHLPGWQVPCRLPSCSLGPASHRVSKGPIPFPALGWGHDLFCATDHMAFGDTFIPCLVCKCITNASNYTGSQLI